MKVCFVSCQYPPLSRTWRRYMFARYLADGGCDVEVVAHGNISQALGTFTDDPDMMREDPEIPVHRVRAVPWHLAGEVLYRSGVIPCPYLNWLGPAGRAGARLVRSAEDAVIGVYPPLTNLLAAWRVARRTGAELVVDFRDEYLGLARGVRRHWAAWCERRLMQNSALVSVATQQVADNLTRRYGLEPDRIHLTHNGYWEEVAGKQSYARREQVRVVYAGALSPSQGVDVLCRAVEVLEVNHPQLAERIEVWIYGPDNFYLRQKLMPFIRGRVRYGGFLGAGQVSGKLLDADVCFLSLASADFSYAVPGKLYEYIAHARPILAALPQGNARKIVEGESFGRVADCGRADALAEQLAGMLDADERDRFHRELVAKGERYAARPHFLSLARRIQELT